MATKRLLFGVAVALAASRRPVVSHAAETFEVNRTDGERGLLTALPA
jgi:hypothetical protein